MIKKLNELESTFDKSTKKRLVVAYGQDPNTIGAIGKAAKEGFVDPILVGDSSVIKNLLKEEGLDESLFEIVHEPDEIKSGKKAVEIIKSGEGDTLMKGLIGTPYFLKAILDKEKGLLKKGDILTHATVLEVPSYHKLMIVSDAAIIPHPTIEQRVLMIKYDIKIANKLGIETPKVALISANEKVSDKVPSTVDAAIISKMGDRKQIKGAIIDGPLALDVAVSKQAAEIKHLNSPVSGDPDIMIFPEITSANVFYKTCTQLAGGKIAGIVTGADVPIILTSRADTEESKFYSIILSAYLA